ncbi:Transcriptional regulatory protein sin3 [Nowakowskiella sp. JEL0078]|nr:Transcriptional regulatory protein sin3 [Nowakowskiella sp. JEL0078]
MDKLIQAIIKQIQVIVMDENRERMINCYYRDRFKATSSPRQEAAYRIEAENLLLDETLFRMEYMTIPRVLTIQVIGKDETASDDTITKEEKWTMYVDHFAQIYSTDSTVRLKRREPFLRRNLPKRVTSEPDGNIVSRSGLELKICVNTYKIFFVENTEDLFVRKFAATLIRAAGNGKAEPASYQELMVMKARLVRAEARRRERRGAAFFRWLENDNTGWKLGLSKDQIDESEFETNSWLVGEGPKRMEIVVHHMGGRRFVIDDIFAGGRLEVIDGDALALVQGVIETVTEPIEDTEMND